MKTARSAVLKNRASAVYSERKFIIRWSTIFVKLALGVVFHVQIQTAWISIRYDFTEFSLGSAYSLSEEVLVRITSIRTGDCLVCFFAASAAKSFKRDIRSASDRAFPVFFGDIFGCSNPYKKRCFSTQEFTRFLSMVSSQRRAMRSDVSFQTK